MLLMALLLPNHLMPAERRACQTGRQSESITPENCVCAGKAIFCQDTLSASNKHLLLLNRFPFKIFMIPLRDLLGENSCLRGVQQIFSCLFTAVMLHSSCEGDRVCLHHNLSRWTPSMTFKFPFATSLSSAAVENTVDSQAAHLKV